MEVNKIYQGDCLEVMKQISGGSIDAIITDPPYGTTACKWDTIIPFEPMWEQLKRVIKKNGAIALFGSQPFTSALVMSNPKMFKYEWVWIKNRGTGHLNAKIMPLSCHETISIFCGGKTSYNPQKLKGKPYQRLNCSREATNKGAYGRMEKTTNTINTGDRYPKSYLEFSKVERTLHPTQKPAALMEYLIKTYTNEGETVLDFTAGSGTTGVACKNLNRNYILIEKDPTYCQIAEARIKAIQDKLI
jgi:site-specific DNA-methyltransferase (adenine-specific)